MLGAIIGDIAGSRFEFYNHRNKNFDLFDESCFFTDDSAMTLAIAKAIMACEGNWELLGANAVRYMREIGRAYKCSYGPLFYEWIWSDNPQPYKSFGNGAAMRVSPCGLIAKTESEAKLLSRKVTEVTHNHKEGIKGAEATTVAIFMAKNGAAMQEIRERIANEYYSLNFKIDELRPKYKFNATCQGTVPQAIACFLESTSFEDAIRTAISLGGDSDTVGAITGAIAESYYGVPAGIKEKALTYLDEKLRAIYDEWTFLNV